MSLITILALVSLGVVGGGFGFGLGRKALRSVDRALDRHVARWLSQQDAADGPYVHLPRGPMPSGTGAPPRRAPARVGSVGLDGLATAR
jgi:hypothetical protein